MNEPFILVPEDFFSISWWLWQWYNNSVYKVMMDLSGVKLPATEVLCDCISRRNRWRIIYIIKYT